MKRFSFRFFLISGILCFGSPAAAQPQAIRFEHITVADGLSNANITASVQDPQGFMWFATHDGLNRYDGYDFTHYRHHPGDSTSLANNSMNDLLVDRLGRLWIVTNLGLDRFDPVSEGFVHHRHDPEDPNSLSHDLVRVLMEDQSGTLWVGTANGLNRLDPTTGSLTRFLHDPNDPNIDNNITALLEDADGMIWVGTDGGLNRLDPETGTFKRFRHTEGDRHSLIDNRIRSLYQDQEGMLWVGTCQVGLHQYDAQADTFDRLLPGAGSPIYAPWTDRTIYGVCAGGVRIIHEDQSGVLWLGSFNAGFNRYNPATGKLTKHAHEPANPTSLSDNAIASLYEDPQGRLWIGTLHGGLNKVDPSGSKFQYHTRDALSPNSLSDKTVWTFEEDRSGMLWIGTLRGGLNRLDRSTGNFTHYAHDPGVPGSLSDNWVVDIYEDRAGVLWVGTPGGLNRFDASTQTFTPFRHDPSDPNSLSDDFITAIQEDHAGALWVGTSSDGLNRFDPLTQAFTRFQYDVDNPASLSSNSIWPLYVDGTETLWIGTGDGLNRFDPETESFTAFLAGRFVTIIGEDAGGTLWVGTQTDGVHRFNPISGTSQRFTVEEGLPSNAIACLVGDESGDLWISTLSKLARFDHEAETFRVYDIGGGLEHNGYVWESCYRSRQGELFFGGYEGYISFFPEDIQDNPYPPQVALTALRVFDQTWATGASEREIRLNHDQNDLSFDYVGLDYTASEQIRIGTNFRATTTGGWMPASSERLGTPSCRPETSYSMSLLPTATASGMRKGRRFGLLLSRRGGKHGGLTRSTDYFSWQVFSL